MTAFLLPDTAAQWIATAAIPALVFAGTVATLYWARYLTTLNRLELAPARTASALQLAADRDWATAHRHTVAVIVVLTVGLGALVIEQSL